MKLVNCLAVLILFGSAAFGQSADLKSFNAEKVKDAALLTWTVPAESRASHFEIERSDDGTSWTTIALMFCFEDNSVEHVYKYADKTLKQTGASYRLRQVDVNKKESFTEIRTAGNTASR